MPLTSKGKSILSSMRKTYGSDRKAKSVFYASINAGKIKGVEGRAEGGRTPLPRPRPLGADAEDEISVRMHKPQMSDRFGIQRGNEFSGPGFRPRLMPYRGGHDRGTAIGNPNEVHLASGGQAPSAPWFERSAAQGMRRTGMLNSMVPGRTDKLPINVGPGSYVVPADIVSAVGQGNSMAGSNILGRMFKPKSANLGLKGRKRAGRMFMADGGAAEDVPIVAAGGEFVISPEEVADVGDGDVNKGHQILDDFVKATRKNHIKTLRKLPAPKKD